MKALMLLQKQLCRTLESNSINIQILLEQIMLKLFCIYRNLKWNLNLFAVIVK